MRAAQRRSDGTGASATSAALATPRVLSALHDGAAGPVDSFDSVRYRSVTLAAGPIAVAVEPMRVAGPLYLKSWIRGCGFEVFHL